MFSFFQWKSGPPAADVGKPELHVFVIDRSSSMSFARNYKKTVADMIVLPSVQEQIDVVGKVVVSVHTFNHEHETPVSFEVVTNAEDLRSKLPTDTFGTTMYYDTMIEVITEIKKRREDFGLISIQVFTDGQNNVVSSKDPELVMNELVEECRKDGWMFTFTGIEIDPHLVSSCSLPHERRQVNSDEDFVATRTSTSARIGALRTQTAPL